MAIGLQLSLLGGWLKEGKGEGERKGIGGGEEWRRGGVEEECVVTRCHSCLDRLQFNGC
jgi:hypothetical protein